jgi:hypothetical protein
MAKAITSKCFIVVLAEFLEVLEYFIDVCDDAEVNCREILQSEKDFITKRSTAYPFMRARGPALCHKKRFSFEAAFRLDRGNKVMILGET